MENKVIGLDGKELKKEEESKDYSSIKLTDVYQPRAFDIVVQEPFNFTQLLHRAQLMKEESPGKDLDQVFEVVAIGVSVTVCKIGDKVMLKGGQMQPINLVSESHFEINEDQVSGVVIHPEYEQIRRFFSNQRMKNNPALGLTFKPMSMGYDKKVQVHGDFNPHKDLPN